MTLAANASILVERLGWILLHCVWQIALIVVAARLLESVMGRSSSRVRYSILLSALALIAIAPLVTAIALSSGGSDPSIRLASAFPERDASGEQPERDARKLAPESSVQSSKEPGSKQKVWNSSINPDRTGQAKAEPTTASWLSNWKIGVLEAIRPRLGWIVLCWGLGCCLFAVRPLVGMHMARRLGKTGFPAPQEVAALMQDLAANPRILQSARLLLSTQINVPILLGFWKPTILLPLSMVTGMPLGQIQAILAHEMAHVKRHDYLVNVLQNVLETMLFFHPGVWWLSRRIREVREYCCDDLAIDIVRDRVEYGRALLAIEERRQRHAALALSAHGGSLVRRMRRIVGAPANCRDYELNGSFCLSVILAVVFLAGIMGGLWGNGQAGERELGQTPDVVNATAGDNWQQWGGSSSRNNVARLVSLPETWNPSTGENILWSTQLGSSTFGSPVISSGKVLIGTNNAAGRVSRFPAEVDLACLQCFDEETGRFLWQYSSTKRPSGRVTDWPMIGLCSTPCIDHDRVWFTTNRAEVVCVDLDGFLDGQNDGPVTDEESTGPQEADVIWRFNMAKELGVSPLHQACSSPTIVGDLVLVNTGNGVDESYQNIPAPLAPSFVALNRHTGHLVWKDGTPGSNLLGSCNGTSPAVARIGDTVQAIFAGSDGWVYAFDATAMHAGKTELLWRFDVNDKSSVYQISGKGNRCMVMGAPVIYAEKVFVATGLDPEQGEGEGALWCIDPTKRGDISDQLVFNPHHGTDPIPPGRFRAADPEQGDLVKPNPNSGVVWKFVPSDVNLNGKLDFEESVHRTCGLPVIADDLLFVADISGILFCMDARSGKTRWTEDLLAAAWSTPLIADGKVFAATEEGELHIFRLSQQKERLGRISFAESLYSTPCAANDRLLIGSKGRLWSISQGAGHAVEKSDRDTSRNDESTTQGSTTPHLTLRIMDTPKLFPDHLNVMAVQFSPDDKSIVTVSLQHDVMIRSWNLLDRKLISGVKLDTPLHGNFFLHGPIVISADCKRLLTAVEGKLQEWDAVTGKLVRTLSSREVPEHMQFNTVTANADFSRIACSGSEGNLSHDSNVFVWDGTTGDLLSSCLHRGSMQTHCVAVSPNGKLVASGGQAEGICVFSGDTGMQVYKVANQNLGLRHPDPKVDQTGANQVLCASFSPDGQILAFGDMLTVKLVEAPSGKLLRTIEAPFRMGKSKLTFSSNGQWLARFDTDRTVQIWSTASGERVASHEAEANSAAFSGDNRWFAVGASRETDALSVYPLSVQNSNSPERE